jgi:hypothetical protein
LFPIISQVDGTQFWWSFPAHNGEVHYKNGGKTNLTIWMGKIWASISKPKKVEIYLTRSVYIYSTLHVYKCYLPVIEK